MALKTEPTPAQAKVFGFLPADTPPWGAMLSLGFQQVLTMFPATVLVAILTKCNYSATNVIASDFCEAIPNIVVPELLRGDCFVAKNAPRNDT